MKIIVEMKKNIIIRNENREVVNCSISFLLYKQILLLLFFFSKFNFNFHKEDN